jgi:uncharacterized membrane protein
MAEEAMGIATVQVSLVTQLGRLDLLWMARKLLLVVESLLPLAVAAVVQVLEAVAVAAVVAAVTIPEPVVIAVQPAVTVTLILQTTNQLECCVASHTDLSDMHSPAH